MDWEAFINPGTVVALLITTAAITLAMAAEAFWPRRKMTTSLSWRWGNNFGLAAVSWYVGGLASVALTGIFAQWTNVHQLGLFHYYEGLFLWPLLSLIIVSQFLSYLSHIAFHKWPLIWPLHAIHHSDVDVDISTSYRHHPLESLVFLPIVLPAIVILGVPAETAMAYQIMHIFLTVFSHTNVRLPEPLDRILCRLIVTPDFHRVHHSSEMQYTNSNYGGIVPWFDYLFGTAKFRDFDSHEEFELGLEYDREKTSNRLDQMIVIPLRKRK